MYFSNTPQTYSTTTHGFQQPMSNMYSNTYQQQQIPNMYPNAYGQFMGQQYFAAPTMMTTNVMQQPVVQVLPPVTLTFKRAGRDAVTLAAQPTDSIATLKTQLELVMGIPATDQRLIVGGEQLQDGVTIAFYSKLTDGAIVHVITRLNQTAPRNNNREMFGWEGEEDDEEEQDDDEPIEPCTDETIHDLMQDILGLPSELLTFIHNFTSHGETASATGNMFTDTTRQLWEEFSEEREVPDDVGQKQTKRVLTRKGAKNILNASMTEASPGLVDGVVEAYDNVQRKALELASVFIPQELVDMLEELVNEGKEEALEGKTMEDFGDKVKKQIHKMITEENLEKLTDGFMKNLGNDIAILKIFKDDDSDVYALDSDSSSDSNDGRNAKPVEYIEKDAFEIRFWLAMVASYTQLLNKL